MAWLPEACPRAALTLVATSSEDVLSAKRLAASWAFAAGSAVWSSFLTEYFGSTKVKSCGFPGFSAEAGAGVTVVVETMVVAAEVIGTEASGAEAGTSFGTEFAATDLAAT